MRPLVRALVLAFVAAPAVAGCVAPGPAADGDAAGAARSALLPDFAGVPEPASDAERGRLWWESFVRATPYRHAGSPTNVRASEMLLDELASIGYDAKIIYYVPPGMESPVGQGIRTVVGVKQGATMPDHVIAWVAHYDSSPATIYAAYDDGSGTAVAMELARALAPYDSSKTLMPIFFDAEEMGLVASGYFVNQAMASDEATFDLVIGHDMTGINCPGHEWKMYQFVAETYVEDLKPVLEALYDARLTPEERACVEFHDEVIRNSDERSFKDAGVPVIRMAGGFKATDYPEYHRPGDTVEFVYEFAGGPEKYQAGFALTVKASYWAAVAFDRLPPIARAP